jgi:hypothetical protein
MRLCHVAALALVGWYLMVPPPYFEKYATSLGLWQVNEDAPISQWGTVRNYDSASECEQHRASAASAAAADARIPAMKSATSEAQGKLAHKLLKELTDPSSRSDEVNKILIAKGLNIGRCIATDDPRLKGN